MSHQERRRFARVRLNSGISSLDGRVIWPNQETTSVEDLSYKGVAVARPTEMEESDTLIKVGLRLGQQPEFVVMARVAWRRPDAVGLEFLEVSPEGHDSMAEFLDCKLAGQTLRQVDAKLYNRALGFSHWLQGADSLSVLVWQDGLNVVQKVRVDWGERSVEFVRGQSLRLDRVFERRTYLVLSQMTVKGLAMEDFVRTLMPGVDSFV